MGCVPVTSGSSPPAQGCGEQNPFCQGGFIFSKMQPEKATFSLNGPVLFPFPSHVAGPGFRSEMSQPNWSFIPLAFYFPPEKPA